MLEQLALRLEQLATVDNVAGLTDAEMTEAENLYAVYHAITLAEARRRARISRILRTFYRGDDYCQHDAVRRVKAVHNGRVQ